MHALCLADACKHHFVELKSNTILGPVVAILRATAMECHDGIVKNLLDIGYPRLAIAIVLCLTWTSNIGHSSLDFSEGYAGAGAVSAALRQRNLNGHTHDIAHSPKCPIHVYHTIF